MTPAERARLVPHAAGLIAAINADNAEDVAHQLGEIAVNLDDATTWALLITLARNIDPDITLNQLRPDPTTLDHIERAWATRAETLRSRVTHRLITEGRRAYNRKDAAA